MKEFIISSITHQKAWNTAWTYAKDLLRKSCPGERIGQEESPQNNMLTWNKWTVRCFSSKNGFIEDQQRLGFSKQGETSEIPAQQEPLEVLRASWAAFPCMTTTSYVESFLSKHLGIPGLIWSFLQITLGSRRQQVYAVKQIRWFIYLFCIDLLSSHSLAGNVTMNETSMFPAVRKFWF